MLRLRGVTVDCADPAGLADFWTAALGYERRSLWEPYAGASDPSEHDPHLTFQRSSDGRTNKLHVDLYADDPDTEAERLIALGAERVRRVEEGDTVVGAP